MCCIPMFSTLGFHYLSFLKIIYGHLAYFNPFYLKLEFEFDCVVKINCLHKIKEERKRSNTQINNTRIYVVRQYAYIHRRRQGESFTKKIGRLQQWYQDSLKETKPQLHPNLSLTKNKPRETLL
jgi:hypothetical protein